MSSEALRQPNPRVSIVMTTYNHVRFIRQAVESCLAQTMADFELIVVNDGSKDGTEAILRSFDDPRLTVITQANQGPSAAFNTGVLAARGDYVALMSGDDLCEPTRLERQWEASRAHPQAVLFSHVVLIDEDGVPMPPPTWLQEIFNLPALSQTAIALRLVAHGNLFPAPTAFVSRALLLEAGLMNPSLFQLQDFDLWLRLLPRAEFRILPAPLVRYRYHPTNLSRPSHATHVATQNELELVYADFFRSLSLEAFQRLFDVPVIEQEIGARPYLDLEIATFLRVFQRPLFDRLSVSFLFSALSSPEGVAIAERCFNYSPRAFWGDLKLTEPGFRMPAPSPDADRMHRRPGAEPAATPPDGAPTRSKLERALDKAGPVGRRVNRLVEQGSRFGFRFSATYLAATVARRVAKSLEAPLLEASTALYAYHPLANLRLAERLRETSPETALRYYKRTFLTETTLFLQRPVYLQQFVSLLKAAGRMAELRSIHQRLSSFDFEPSPVEAVFAEVDLGDRYKPELYPDHPVRQGLFHSVLGLKPIEAWLSEHGGSCQVFAEPSVYEFTLPKVYGEPAPQEPYRLEVPRSYLATVRDVLVGPGFTVVSPETEDLLLYEPAAHPRFGHVSGLRGLMAPVPGYPDKVRLKMNPSHAVHLPEAILLSGRSALNYYHWLIEYLPKFLEIEAKGGLDGVPLLVSDRMPIQHYEALHALLGKDHPIVYMNPWMLASVETLHIPSFSTYVPDDFDSPLWKAGVVSKRHVEFLRTRFLPTAGGASETGWGRRIFVSRSRNAGRAMSNEVAIVAAARRAGFRVVFPELMSFDEQVACFHGADVIMGPTGAAFSNVVFCRPGTRVFGLTSERNAAFCNFANLASTVGCDFVNVTGPNNKPRESFPSEEEFAHSSFTVPFAKIEAILHSLDTSPGG